MEIQREIDLIKFQINEIDAANLNPEEEICEGIRFFNEVHPVDTIIVGRGGGSIEDLWSFNEEEVARCVFESKITYYISCRSRNRLYNMWFCSGYEGPPTPSAAAEIATPSLEDLHFKLDNIQTRMNKSLSNIIEYDEQKLKYTFKRINTILNDYIINDKIIELDKITEKINLNIENKIEKESMNLRNLGSLLHNLSPLKTLDRGYSIINKDDVVVNSVLKISENDEIEVILSNGSLDCTVNKINKKEV